MIPSWSVPRSTSSSARIIPSDTSPRTLRRSSVRPFGSVAPGSATATVAPAPKFHAPHTIERGSGSPTSTFVSCSRSAFGCFSASSTFPTRNRARLRFPSGTPRWTTRSPSQLVKTSRRASSSTGRSKSTYSRSQLTGTFISELLQHADVVLPEEAQVGEAVTEHRDALDAEAEGEAGPDVRVVADVGEHLRIDPAGSAHLDPAGVLAHRAALSIAQKTRHVELDRGLG